MYPEFFFIGFVAVVIAYFYDFNPLGLLVDIAVFVGNILAGLVVLVIECCFLLVAICVPPPRRAGGLLWYLVEIVGSLCIFILTGVCEAILLPYNLVKHFLYKRDTRKLTTMGSLRCQRCFKPRNLDNYLKITFSWCYRTLILLGLKKVDLKAEEFCACKDP